MPSKREWLKASGAAAIAAALPTRAGAETVSTTRILQVSGRRDPEELFHYQDTSQWWGIDGVDLGASTRHGGRTYIFFGDVIPPAPEMAIGADAIGVIDDIRVPRHANIAGAKQASDQSDAFFIGEDGALYVAWVVGRGNWFHPFPISAPDLAPPGACVAAAHQFPHQLDVFFIGTNGALYVAWVVEGGIWQGPLQISEPCIAKPGGRLVAARQSDRQLDVFFIGTNRRLHVAWVVDGGKWRGPLAVGDPAVPYPEPGSGIAACSQGADQLDVFFVGDDGGFYVAWSRAGGDWEGPQKVSPQGVRVSRPGAELAAFNQTPDQVTAVFVNEDGRLSSMWVVGGGIWQGPAPTVPGFHRLRAGAPVTVARQGSNQWDAILVDQEGALHVYWVVGGDPWQGPASIAPPGSAHDSGTLAAVQQIDDLLTVVFAGRTGELCVNWAQGPERWQGPVTINPEMIEVRYVTDGRRFRPFTVKGTQTDPNQIWDIGLDATPTGAFSHGGRVYVCVFALAGGTNPVSFLTSSDRPESPEPFQFHFAFSGAGFYQVAPVVVQAAEFPMLATQAKEGVVLFGHGSLNTAIGPMNHDCIPPTSLSGVNLAFMPIDPVRGPVREGTLYYAGGDWTPVASDARSLFTTCYYWTSLSAGRVPGSGQWIVLYQASGPRELAEPPIRPPGSHGVAEAHKRPIYARIADTPWDIAAAADIPIFDPQRDSAWDRFMFGPDAPKSDRNAPDHPHPAFAYGAYLLHKYTRWDAAERTLTIFYLMSTGRPYQVQLMRTSVVL